MRKKGGPELECMWLSYVAYAMVGILLTCGKH
jgi:hypothetical protein